MARRQKKSRAPYPLRIFPDDCPPVRNFPADCPLALVYRSSCGGIPAIKSDLDNLYEEALRWINNKEAARRNDAQVSLAASNSSSSSSAREPHPEQGVLSSNSEIEEEEDDEEEEEEGLDEDYEDDEGDDVEEDSGSSKKRKAQRTVYRSASQIMMKAARLSAGNGAVLTAGPVDTNRNLILRDQVGARARGTGVLSSSITTCNCLKRLKDLAETALLSALRASSEHGKGAWNLARLKPLLEIHAFDERGNYLYHHHCLCVYFKLHCDTVTGYHRERIKHLREPLETVPKEVVVKNDLYASVVVPEEAGIVTQRKYVDEQRAGASVKIVRRAPMHGLAGKPSNRAKLEARKRVREFVEDHCSFNGRTPQPDGRSRGAPFYFDERFKVVCASNTHRDKEVLSTTILEALKTSGELQAKEIPAL